MKIGNFKEISSNFSSLRTLSLSDIFKIPSSQEEQRELLLYLVLLILLAAASIFGVSNFIYMNKAGMGRDNPAFSDNSSAPKGIAEVDALNKKMEAYSVYKNESGRMAVLAEAIGKNPVASFPVPVSSSPELAVPEFVPSMVIKALLVMDSASVVTLDIEGEEPGQIFKKDSVFGQGRGKITAIDTKGVSWTWAKKKHRTDL